MYNYYIYEVKETLKRTAAIAGAAAVITAGTYGGSKIGQVFVDAAEDAISAGAKEVRKTIKKKFHKKRFF